MTDEKNIMEIWGKGLRYADSGDLIKASDCYKEALESMPPKCYGASLVWWSWGELFEKVEMYDNAIDCYKKSINADETNYDAYANLIELCTKLQQYETALTYVDLYLLMEPENDTALSHKGALLNCLNRTSEAIIYFKKAEKINPNNPQVIMAKQNGMI